MNVRLLEAQACIHPLRAAFALAMIGTFYVAPVHAQDVAAGAKVFQRCAVCHASTASGPAKMGPSLAGVVGRRAGRQTGFRYSAAMAGASFNWDAQHLDAFITRPQQVVKGTKMAFAGVSNAKERQDLIAYLRSLRGAPR